MHSSARVSFTLPQKIWNRFMALHWTENAGQFPRYTVKRPTWSGFFLPPANPPVVPIYCTWATRVSFLSCKHSLSSFSSLHIVCSLQSSYCLSPPIWNTPGIILNVTPSREPSLTHCIHTTQAFMCCFCPRHNIALGRCAEMGNRCSISFLGLQKQLQYTWHFKKQLRNSFFHSFGV